MNVPISRIPVAVLGATGAVGQTFLRCLADHPWFEVTEVAASERSAGRQYGDVVRWLEGVLPDAVARQLVRPCDPAAVSAPLVFSALDSSVAGEVEAAFARAGRLVLSNAKNFRMAPDVPLVIPEVNGDHLALLTRQRELRGWTGGIVTNANCAVTVVAMALAPLHAAFGVRQVMVATMQAVSGAGYPGVPSLDILGNVVPYIGGEEDKMEKESQKILGADGGRVPLDCVISAHTNRVPVLDGHTMTVSVEFARRVSPEDVVAAMRAFRGRPQELGLPSAPVPAIEVMDEPNRPQPRLDADRGDGMTVSVGRVRECPVFHVKFVALAHNVVRGAAGAAILNAELMVAEGMV
jgi:aspartate-semialdehyde dehydrogenase